MSIHKNARLIPLRREEMAAIAVLSGALTKAQVALVYAISRKIASRWVERFRKGGRAAMADRSSRPGNSPRQTDAVLATHIAALGRQRLTGRHISMETGASPATVGRVLKRAGLSRIKDIAPAEPVMRYEYAAPGDLIHIDIKRLGRFNRGGHRITGDRTGQRAIPAASVGNTCICVIDDASRIAFTDILPNEKAESAIAFLKAAVAYCQSLGITVKRVMTDNGACHIAKDFAKACKALRLKHIRTKPYTPKTNGKNLLQTALLCEWAYARAYPSSEHRKQHLPNWNHMYNWHRPHGGIKSKIPISRPGLNRDNLLRLHLRREAGKIIRQAVPFFTEMRNRFISLFLRNSRR